MKTRIFLVRHAEAEGNLYRRCHGQFESSVTLNGMRQIEALARRFAGEPVDACYSSDLLRTRTTARAVTEPKGLALRLDPRFREVALGVWEDVPFGRISREDPVMLDRFSSDPAACHVAGGEDYETYTGRFLEALRDVAARHAGGTAVVFSHGCVIRGSLLRLFDRPDLRAEIGHCDNTGVSLLEYEDGRFSRIYLNDNSHLTGGISTLARQNWWREAGNRRDCNLWFRPMRPDPAWYTACRKEAWETVYGPAGRFDGRLYYRAALEDAAGVPEALTDVMLEDRRVGVVQMIPARFAERGAGYVSFLYLLPELRRQGLGVQLIGQAVSVSRRLGRSRLQLSVSPRNLPALAFYRKLGFAEIGRSPGRQEDLILMDLDIAVDRCLRQPVCV